MARKNTAFKLKKGIKTAFAGLLDTPFFDFVASHYYSTHAAIFMLHRFETGLKYKAEHTAEQLDAYLSYLQRKRYNFMSLDDLVLRIRENRPIPPKTLAFTIDDGYFDQLEVSVPIFEKYACPATYFVVTEFVDGKIWMWDSKIYYLESMLDQQKFNRFADCVPGLSGASNNLSATQVIFKLANHELSEIERMTVEFSKMVGIDIPMLPTSEYRACTWDDLRSASRKGMVVGAHTLSHPLLSREAPREARRQILGAKSSLESHLETHSSVFCYPVGRRSDFSERDAAITEELGYAGAVSTIPGVVNLDSALFELPRYGLPHSKADLIQYASWIEAGKSKIRFG